MIKVFNKNKNKNCKSHNTFESTVSSMIVKIKKKKSHFFAPPVHKLWIYHAICNTLKFS